MMIDTIRSLMHQVPFQPFVIHLSDGRPPLYVPHPDFIFLLKGNKPDFIVARPEGGFDVIACDLVQNVSVPSETKP